MRLSDYTVDGSVPSAASQTYSGPITLTNSATISAVAIKESVPSPVVAHAFTVRAQVAVAPTTVTLKRSQTHSFTATVSNSTNQAVSWSLSPAIGRISSSGLYTAPASVTTAQTVMVTATSALNSAMRASAKISLAPAVSVTVAPGSATLTPFQTQTFTATVSDSPNTAVTWSLSPAVGSISTAGVYTAPAYSWTTQTVTVIATSSADPTETASATVTLSPPVNVVILSPTTGATLSGTMVVTAQINVQVDSRGSYLIVDGVEYGTRIVTQPPYVYSLDTTTLTNGQHTLQVWAHDSNNDSVVSAALPVVVANGGTGTITSVSVNCSPTSLNAGAISSCSSAVLGTGGFSSAVTWTASAGKISSSGVYTAPTIAPTSGTAVITATSTQDTTKSASTTVAITTPATITSVSVSCSPTSVNVGATSSCSSTVLGAGAFSSDSHLDR